jgi:hypothetical protein
VPAAPSESTFRRLLQQVDAGEVDRVVHAWLVELAEGGAVSIDGKALRGSSDGEAPAVRLLAAVTHDKGVVVASGAGTPCRAARRGCSPRRAAPQLHSLPAASARCGRDVVPGRAGAGRMSDLARARAGDILVHSAQTIR